MDAFIYLEWLIYDQLYSQKYISFFIAMDFRNIKVVLFINGKIRSEKKRGLCPMNGKLIDAKHLPMVFRLDRYFFAGALS